MSISLCYFIRSKYSHVDEAEQGSHITEENVLTLKDLKNIFVDDDEEWMKLESLNSGTKFGDSWED